MADSPESALLIDVVTACPKLREMSAKEDRKFKRIVAEAFKAVREPLEQRIRELENSRSVAVDLAAVSGFEAGKADTEIRVRELEQENERLRVEAMTERAHAAAAENDMALAEARLSAAETLLREEVTDFPHRNSCDYGDDGPCWDCRVRSFLAPADQGKG
jgi:uncharacterized tellurite resistance protein B-like protein